MKSSVRLFCVSIGLGALFTCNAFAEENNLKYSLSLVSMSMDYNENQDGTWLDGETATLGKIYGYDMSFGYLFNRDERSVDEIYLDVMSLSGNTAYDGYIRNTWTPLKGTTSNFFADASMGYKHTMRLDNRFDCFMGIALGYHAWDRKLSSYQEELYEWKSIRPSIGASVNIEKLNLGVSLEYQYGFDTIMHASDTGDTYKLGGADVVKIGFPIRYNYAQNLEFFTQYTYTSQTIKHSNVVNGLLEPDSTNNQNYLQIGATFKF